MGSANETKTIPWGDGPRGDQDDGQTTARGILLAAIGASEVGDHQREAAVWSQEIHGSPAWHVVRDMLAERAAIATARRDGFQHSWDETAAYADSLGARSTESDGRGHVQHHYQDGSWLAFERAPRQPGLDQPDLWRQVTERPEWLSDPSAQQEEDTSGETESGVDASTESDARATQGAGDQNVDLPHEAGPEISEQGAGPGGSGDRAGESEGSPGVHGAPQDAQGLTLCDGWGNLRIRDRDTLCPGCKLCRAPDVDESIEEPAGQPGSSLPELPRLRVTCDECSSNRIMPHESWPPANGNRSCQTCRKGLLFAMPSVALAAGEVVTVDGIEGHSLHDCGACGHHAVFHVGRDTGPKTGRWRCTATGCECREFPGHARVEPLTQPLQSQLDTIQNTLMESDPAEAVAVPTDEAGDSAGTEEQKPKCDGCSAQAALRFASESAKTNAMNVCRPCSARPELKRGRRKTVAL